MRDICNRDSHGLVCRGLTLLYWTGVYAFGATHWGDENHMRLLSNTNASVPETRLLSPDDKDIQDLRMLLESM